MSLLIECLWSHYPLMPPCRLVTKLGSAWETQCSSVYLHTNNAACPGLSFFCSLHNAVQKVWQRVMEKNENQMVYHILFTEINHIYLKFTAWLHFFGLELYQAVSQISWLRQYAWFKIKQKVRPELEFWCRKRKESLPGFEVWMLHKAISTKQKVSVYFFFPPATGYLFYKMIYIWYSGWEEKPF